MKRLTYLIITLAFSVGILLAFDSCKKEKEDETNNDGGPTGSGEIEYMSEKYAINQAYYEYYGLFEGIYNYRLYLFSGGVDIENESGYGNAVAIYFSTYASPLPTGTIPYYSQSVDPVPSVEAEVVLGYDLDTEIGIQITHFTQGELTMTKSPDGKTYTVQFNWTTMDNEVLSGNYSGQIIEF